mgnify:CR=1 FL=1|tara:strand:+ start:418 stop:612 length:195 start_codon:yes stop_codon:yes gene_type:complete
MAAQLGITTLVNLAQLIVDKLENSLDLTTPDFARFHSDKHKYLDFKKAIAEKDKDTLVYLLTKI